MTDKDRLHEMFDMQFRFMKRLKVTKATPDNLRTMFTAITVELAELMQELNWKPWKKTRKYSDTDKVLEEYVDVFHFVMELGLLLGICPRVLYEAYLEKMRVNIKRQKGGY